ncbi:hypothetical protein PM10SUCC1_28560 [Propionigenium maris DSM 9537]|uniref:DUF5655 domain-containing protein n=1 Tax=Propionigenium maris DSM 9537 TaxID=1123000 RepID=A0A9W6GPE1_9FUSO|nr:DUF5655 domain-containing protein [Propionigenium maris]GLI57342.1 hypothetical protein PM10SUCC1_28560 [Propionigenium maris DSM 9537]
MPLFNRGGNKLETIKQKNFPLEKDLQNLVENNLEEIFSCRFVASEFHTGNVHSGRIDSLAISEDNNPVIIEYKKEESSSLLNQSLFYLSWLKDHKGDFQMAVNKTLGDVEVDWSSIRVICIAPGYKKYDLHAAEMMNAPIELWKYKNYENGMFNLEEVFSRKDISTPKPMKVNKGKKECKEEASIHTYEDRKSKLGTEELKNLLDEIRDYTVDLGESVEEAPKKLYVAYKTSKNFMCIECQRKRIILYLKFTSEQLEEYSSIGRDVTNVGHFGTGNFEFIVKSLEDLDNGKGLIKASFENIGE